MSNVFKDNKYAIQYEQFNLNLGNPYGKFARAAIDLAKISPDSCVLDLGCGTGVSTSTLFDKVKGIKVTGVEQSEEFLKIARLKFGLLDNPAIFQEIKEDHPYPKILIDICGMGDLEAHLKECTNRYGRYKQKVNFYCKDASKLKETAEKDFDYVLASQVIHWFRKKNVKPGEAPNLEYEREVLQEVRNKLKRGGLFVFNTNGADFEFNENSMNDKHMYKTPFFKAFKESLNSQLDSGSVSGQHYTFNHSEIERIMKENGFTIEDSKSVKIEFDPDNFKQICLISGQMQIFEKGNINISADERERILGKALDYALKKSSIEERPFFEMGINYVVKKH